MAETLPVIKPDKLTQHYRQPFFTSVVRARALSDLSLEVNRGEVFGLLGPNGSGKSTAIKRIRGRLRPTSGRVELLGKDPNELSVKNRVGYLPEESYLYRFLNATETLDFYARLFRIDRKERRRRIGFLLDLVGLTDVDKRPVGEFSKGMQRRLAFAQSLINNPELIILDEPASGMDPIGTAEVKSLIGRLRSEGKTILMCSHLLADVEDVCDRIVILDSGRNLVTGTVQSLTERESLRQVTAAMDDDTVTQVKALIHERQGSETPIQVAPPTERLEQFFLRIIQNAHHDDSEVWRDFASVDLDFLKRDGRRDAPPPTAAESAAPPGHDAEEGSE